LPRREGKTTDQALGEEGKPKRGVCGRKQRSRSGQQEHPIPKEATRIADSGRRWRCGPIARRLGDSASEYRQEHDANAGGEIGKPPIEIGQGQTEDGNPGAQAAGRSVQADSVRSHMRSNVFGQPDHSQSGQSRGSATDDGLSHSKSQRSSGETARGASHDEKEVCNEEWPAAAATVGPNREAHGDDRSESGPGKQRAHRGLIETERPARKGQGGRGLRLSETLGQPDQPHRHDHRSLAGLKTGRRQEGRKQPSAARLLCLVF